MTALGLLWLPVVPTLSSQLYIYLQSVQGYIAAPITCVFAVGLLWRGANGTGALTCLIVGSSLGLLRLIAEITLGRQYQVGLPVLRVVYALFVGSNFLHFTALLFVTCVGVLVAASFAAPLPEYNLAPSSIPAMPSLRSLFMGETLQADAQDLYSAEGQTKERRRQVMCLIASGLVLLSVASVLVIFN